VLEHREQQQVLERHHGKLRPVDCLDRPRLEGARPRGDLQLPREPAGFPCRARGRLVVLRVERDDTPGPVADVEHERDVEIAEASEVRGIEAARRVREADLGDRAGRVRPPCVDGFVCKLEIRGEVAEEIECQRRRPQELGPQSLVVEALVRLDEGRPCPRRRERGRGEERRAGLARVIERQAAPERTRWLPLARNDRLRTASRTMRLQQSSRGTA
jgi:hypothetical protein